MKAIAHYGLGTAIALICAVAVAGPSQAALVTCPAAFTANGTAKVHNGGNPILTAASACQYISPADNNNNATIANINTAAFFGFNDWADNGQTQLNPPNDQSSAWTIASVNFALFDYIIVFKDGSDTNLIAFLFNESFSSGTWNTPFTQPPFVLNNPNQQKDVSHLTIARRSNANPVPEPSTLGLIGLGLLGLGAMARRRRKLGR